MTKRDRDSTKPADDVAPAPLPSALVELPKAPEVSVSHVVTGPAAHDPLAFRERPTSVISLTTWIAAKKMRTSAGFTSWALTNAPGDRPASEWASLFEKFQKTPVK